MHSIQIYLKLMSIKLIMCRVRNNMWPSALFRAFQTFDRPIASLPAHKRCLLPFLIAFVPCERGVYSCA